MHEPRALAILLQISMTNKLPLAATYLFCWHLYNSPLIRKLVPVYIWNNIRKFCCVVGVNTVLKGWLYQPHIYDCMTQSVLCFATRQRALFIFNHAFVYLCRCGASWHQRNIFMTPVSPFSLSSWILLLSGCHRSGSLEEIPIDVLHFV